MGTEATTRTCDEAKDEALACVGTAATTRMSGEAKENGARTDRLRQDKPPKPPVSSAEARGLSGVDGARHLRDED